MQDFWYTKATYWSYPSPLFPWWVSLIEDRYLIRVYLSSRPTTAKEKPAWSHLGNKKGISKGHESTKWFLIIG